MPSLPALPVLLSWSAETPVVLESNCLAPDFPHWMCETLPVLPDFDLQRDEVCRIVSRRCSIVGVRCQLARSPVEMKCLKAAEKSWSPSSSCLRILQTHVKYWGKEE